MNKLSYLFLLSILSISSLAEIDLTRLKYCEKKGNTLELYSKRGQPIITARINGREFKGIGSAWTNRLYLRENHHERKNIESLCGKKISTLFSSKDFSGLNREITIVQCITRSFQEEVLIVIGEETETRTSKTLFNATNDCSYYN